jgi:outer membrane protein OmpA-like peptidoglycan-associated protein
MTHRARRASQASLTALASFTALAVGAPAVADDGEVDQPPGYEAPPVPEIDPDATGLMLTDGAELAEPEVVDIKWVTEDLSGGGETETGTGGSGSSGGGGGGEDTGGGTSPDGGGDSGQREEITGDQHKFTLQTDVIFGEGSSEITDASREALMDVAAAIDEYQPTMVNIFGFTDDQGSYQSGVTLSTDRARNAHVALLDLIQNAGGISFNVRGYSEDYPLYDNTTEEGRQQNRRVEISWPTNEE